MLELVDDICNPPSMLFCVSVLDMVLIHLLAEEDFGRLLLIQLCNHLNFRACKGFHEVLHLPILTQ